MQCHPDFNIKIEVRASVLNVYANRCRQMMYRLCLAFIRAQW
jgi:hypothetical protein